MLKAATNIAGSQVGFISKCITACGNTVAEPAANSTGMKRAPFSDKKPARKVVFKEKLISVARGCVWGLFMPQGPRKPIASRHELIRVCHK